MTNQPNRRSLQPSPPTIPDSAMEQRNGHQNLHHIFGSEGLENIILQDILDSQHNSQLLSDLAHKIGSYLAVDACIVVSTTIDGSKVNNVDHWQAAATNLAQWKQISSNLAHLVLSQDDSSHQGLIQHYNSSLFAPIENLMTETLPDKTWLGMAIYSQRQINGLILLLKSHSAGWTSSERELLTQTANPMAIAISQIQLQQQAKTKARYQSLLKNLSREISYNSHPQQLFDKCLLEIGATFGLDRGMILTLKYHNPLAVKSRAKKTVKGKVEVSSYWTATNSNQDIFKDEVYFNLHDSLLCQQALQNAPQYLCFESDRSFPDLAEQSLPASIGNTGSALFILPLMGKKSHENSPATVLGFLVLQHHSPRYWSEDELDLLDWIGVQISTAIMHHQTLTQVQSIVEERTAQLKWSLDVQAKLSEKMRQHISQLQQVNQLKDDFMNSMSHELKTPLTSMKMAIKMLRQTQISPEMREKYLNILEQEWDREYNLIKDLLTLQQVESGELSYSPQELDLNQTLNHLAASFADQWHRDKGIELEASIDDPNLKIHTDVESLNHVLNELLVNAGKYSDDNTKIQLTANSQANLKGKNIVIAIANYGAGIAPEELPHIFEKFRRGKGVTDRAVPGTGLGLTLVQYLVEHLSGTIEVTSEPIAEQSQVFLTTFVLKLPQFQPTIG